MSLWNKTTASPKHLPSTVGSFATAAATTNIFFVDETECQQPATRDKGITGPGWWTFRTYTDSDGKTRNKAELLAYVNAPAATSGDTVFTKIPVGIASITGTGGGTGYTPANSTSAPLVIGAPNIAGGIQATGTCTTSGGVITASSMVITSPGSGYTSAPTVTGTGGTGATLTATLQNPGFAAVAAESDDAFVFDTTLVFSVQPVNASRTGAGALAPISVTCAGSPVEVSSKTYLWQYALAATPTTWVSTASPSGGLTFTGGTSNTLTVTVSGTGNNGDRVRCVVSGATGSIKAAAATSQSAIITVN